MRRRLPFFHPATLVATAVGIGNAPIASGTWASLAVLPVAWIVAEAFGALWLIAAGILSLLVGLWATARYCAASGEKDPSRVVIDEVAGQFIALAPIAVPEPVTYAVAFFAFRFFDIVKPWPAGWCDRELPGAPGVMFDDIFAGIYAALVVLATMALNARFEIY